ncbi:MAG: pyridoxamine 5'-phosphate oxidase [Pseudomonadota bacterium]
MTQEKEVASAETTRGAQSQQGSGAGLDNAARDRSDVRREYRSAELARADLDPDPVRQFARWLTDAESLSLLDATAMTLATVDQAGQPSARIVLLKSFTEEGFVFFTDTHSDKGRELQANPKASLLFYWRELERQVRIHGTVHPVDTAQAQAYFASRPRDSQLSAAASEQSQPVTSRDVLMQRVTQLQDQLGDQPLNKPERWGGYRVQAQQFEFWQGRSNRLHDRFRYQLAAPASVDNDSQITDWQITRLQP